MRRSWIGVVWAACGVLSLSASGAPVVDASGSFGLSMGSGDLLSFSTHAAVFPAILPPTAPNMGESKADSEADVEVAGQRSSGACCLPSGMCIEVSQDRCLALSGVYQGDSIECGDVSCPPPAKGSIVGWGSNTWGQCNAPDPNVDFVAVAGTFDTTLGLKGDGSIVAWGGCAGDRCNVPEPNSDFIAVETGTEHCLGLKSDGSIVAWGFNTDGCCDVPEPAPEDPPFVFVGIAAGYSHSLGLKDDGSIMAWGSNAYGECDVPETNADFVAVAAGERHSLGLKADGSIVGWGFNGYGQCDVPGPNSDFVAVAGGGFHSLGLKSDGSIVAWGRNENGECDVPEPNAGFVRIAGGGEHSLGMKFDGSIVAWGWNPEGECDVPEPNGDFTAIAGGNYYSLGIQPFGACCALDGSCAETTPSECWGEWQGAGTTCDPDTCWQPPIGACCDTNGVCAENAAWECYGGNGFWLGAGTTCDPNPCVIGACCLQDGSCVDVPEGTCVAPWGDYQSGSNCASTICPEPVAWRQWYHPTDDTFVSQKEPNGNRGSAERMDVRNKAGGPSSDWERDALMRFDISDIPQFTPIKAATLHLYYHDYWDNDPAGRELTCHRVTDDWHESDVTWNSRPSYVSDPTSGCTVPNEYGWMQWDVTSDVQAFVNGQASDYGWQIMDPNDWAAVNIPITRFRTRDAGEEQWPYLEVCFGPPLPGDCNGDGTLNIMDLALFLNAINGPDAPPGAGCEAGDCDCDYDIDLADFAVFAQAFYAP